ncbi:MAG: hypothetical protein JXA82_18035 [Sedimentisphaerales bacterium]|nr:hypothetical protein [Sedimentisphaerales bacterium]
MEETRYDSTPAPLTRIQYTLGEDVISQTESTYSRFDGQKCWHRTACSGMIITAPCTSNDYEIK